MTIKLFADGADLEGIVNAANDKRIKGFTTNPTLMRQAGITDYEKFARTVIEYLVENRPETSLSLEVFADDFTTMHKQALVIDSWAKEYDYQVYVKIPITNTIGISTSSVYKDLSDNGISVNVTAVMSQNQIVEAIENMNFFVPGIISIFGGRIADAGVDPEESMRFAADYYNKYRNHNMKLELLWASPREPFNFIHAERSGADIITMTPALIKKMDQTFGTNLDNYSLETVKMFYNDAAASGFDIDV